MTVGFATQDDLIRFLYERFTILSLLTFQRDRYIISRKYEDVVLGSFVDGILSLPHKYKSRYVEKDISLPLLRMNESSCSAEV